MSQLKFISSESPDFDRLRAYYLNGIHDCTIHGYPNPCRAYIWEYKHGHFFWRGLIVDATDTPAIEKAEAAYRERRQFL